MSVRRPGNEDWAVFIDEIQAVREEMLRLVDESREVLADVHPDHQPGARNLLHYLAFRNRDLRPLQARLAAAGLSSLGRAESHVLAAVDAVLHVLHCLMGRSNPASAEPARDHLDLTEGQRLLDAHAEAVLGARPTGRNARIMVTMPSEAAEAYTLVSRLVEAGMDCMRVNCAHDTADDWKRMIEHLHRAMDQHGRSCRILMDLAGPKVRTGDVEAGPAVVKFKPERNAHGRVTAPARVWLYAADRPHPAPTTADASLPVAGAWLRKLEPGDRITFEDARGSSRELRVIAVAPEGCWTESRKTAYVETGTRLRIERKTRSAGARSGRETLVGSLPASGSAIELQRGDELVVTRPDVPGRNAVSDDRGRILTPATIGCTAEQIFEDGLNLPDTDLNLPALTDKDRDDLEFVATHADMVALSFVNSVEDVRALRELLDPLGDAQPAIVLKIETRRAVDNLPAMLIEAMKSPRCAVMIARGDLAVECGFERLAEVQEEILWLCEAAHVPVIWATQVLESLAKQGIPSRAEVTDAAMAHRAECVMLNKGRYIVNAVEALDEILRRMRGHQVKKRPMLRRLNLASSFKKARAALEPEAPAEVG